ncbi:hypothetical protein [Phormidium nigroviride]
MRTSSFKQDLDTQGQKPGFCINICQISRRKKEEGRRKKEEGRRKKEEKLSYLGKKEECLYSRLFSHPDLMFN